MQIHGLAADGTPSPGTPAMGGFVDNYMRQPPPTPRRSAAGPARRDALFHARPGAGDQHAGPRLRRLRPLARLRALPDLAQPVLCPHRHGQRLRQQRADAFPLRDGDGVQPPMDSVGQSWRVYFHDMPQSATLAKLWDKALTHFRHFEADFADDASGRHLARLQFHRAALLHRRGARLHAERRASAAQRLPRRSADRRGLQRGAQRARLAARRCWSSPTTNMAAATTMSSRRPPRPRAGRRRTGSTSTGSGCACRLSSCRPG